jgi:HD-like signal output (HDOD) protein
VPALGPEAGRTGGATGLTRKETALPAALPVFSPIAIRLMGLVAQDDVNLREVAKYISSDAALSARVLRLANSPLLGRSYEVRDVLHALAILGLPKVTSLVITSALSHYLPPNTDSDLLRSFWRHNLACALLAEQVEPARPAEAAVLYTAGLLHALGQLALIAGGAAQYREAMRWSAVNQTDLLEAERSFFGTDHASAGSALMRSWGFPAELVEAAACYRRPETSRFRSVAVTGRCCRIACALGFEDGGYQKEPLDLREALPGRTFLIELVPQQINAIECWL